MNSIQHKKDKLFLIIDFEATCGEKNEIPKGENEIIEFAGILFDENYNVLFEFCEFVKPKRHPNLTKFCSKLTSINQKDVENAKTFLDVLNDFKSQILNYDPLFLSWGSYDKKLLLNDCLYNKTEYPFLNDNHYNIKNYLFKHLGIKKEKGLHSTLRYLKLRFEGFPHRGIDDCRNILKILKVINFPLSLFNGN